MVNRTKASVDLDAIFAALAHPIRRAIVERLAGGDATVGELAEPHKVSLPAISKHLRVLEDAGLLQVEPEGRVHRCQLDVDARDLRARPAAGPRPRAREGASRLRGGSLCAARRVHRPSRPRRPIAQQWPAEWDGPRPRRSRPGRPMPWFG